MVKLVEGPTTAIVQAYKRRIDFYVVNGQHRARAWPRWTMTERSPQVVLQQPWLTAANQAYGQLGSYKAWQLAHPYKPGTWTARDRFMKYYFAMPHHALDYHRTSCAHQTPYATPDPFAHYGFPLGWRLRQEPDGSRHLDVTSTTNVGVQMLWAEESLLPWWTFKWQQHQYTRRGIRYTGGFTQWADPGMWGIDPVTPTAYGFTVPLAYWEWAYPGQRIHFTFGRANTPYRDSKAWFSPLAYFTAYTTAGGPGVLYHHPPSLQDCLYTAQGDPLAGKTWPNDNPTFW